MRTFFLLSCVAALASCSHPQNPERRDPLADQVTGPIQHSDPVFLKDDPATRISCTSDDDCPANAMCYPRKNVCFSTYPAMSMMAIDVNCPLVPVYFAFDSTALRPEADQWLTYDASCLKARGAKHVTVAGYADARGEREHNIELSRQRAEVVQQALNQRGVLDVGVAGQGATDFVLTGTSEHDYAYNRRAELLAH